jgi:hypothetical protein
MSSLKSYCGIIHKNVNLFDCFLLIFLLSTLNFTEVWSRRTFFVFRLIFSGPFLSRLMHLPSKPYLSFYLLSVLLPLVLSFRFFFTPSQQLGFLPILALMLFRVSFSFIYFVFRLILRSVYIKTPSVYFALCELLKLTSYFIQIKSTKEI